MTTGVAQEAIKVRQEELEYGRFQLQIEATADVKDVCQFCKHKLKKLTGNNYCKIESRHIFSLSRSFLITVLCNNNSSSYSASSSPSSYSGSDYPKPYSYIDNFGRRLPKFSKQKQYYKRRAQ